MYSQTNNNLRDRWTKVVRRVWLRVRPSALSSKRQQFVAVTCILTAGLVLTQLVGIEQRYAMVAIVSLLTYMASAWALRDDLRGIEWVMLLALPTMFTAGVLLFYFLLPVRWLTRLPVAAGFAIGFYALLLTENIYNVAVNRTIALLRAAHSVGFLLTIITFFLLIQATIAFGFPLVWYLLFVGILTFVLTVQALWSVDLEDRIVQNVTLLTMITTMVMLMFFWALYFWPVNKTLLVIMLSALYYSMIGMAQQFISQRLYKSTIIEYGMVATIVSIIILLTANWRPGI